MYPLRTILVEEEMDAVAIPVEISCGRITVAWVSYDGQVGRESLSLKEFCLLPVVELFTIDDAVEYLNDKRVLAKQEKTKSKPISFKPGPEKLPNGKQRKWQQICVCRHAVHNHKSNCVVQGCSCLKFRQSRRREYLESVRWGKKR